MTSEQFILLLRAKAASIDLMARDTMPILAGNLAKRHIDEDFRRGGFTHAGFTPWQPTRRQSTAHGAQAEYSPLLSGRNHLARSTDFRTGPYTVTVFNDAPYASVHNRGATLHPTVTPAMRRFAWAMYYREAGLASMQKADPSPEASRWKALALTRKAQLNVTIPRRQFMPEGDIGPELAAKLQSKMDEKLREIINS